MTGCVFDFIDNFRVHAVEESSEGGLTRFPHNSENHKRNEEPYNGISQWIAHPNTKSSHENGQAGKAIDARMVTVCDERGAAHLFTDFNAKVGHSLITCKADNGGNNDGP